MIKISYIEFKAVSKSYKESNKNALKDFNLHIEKGEFIVLVGPSGSGKSTLLELICGFEELTTGTIKIDNKIINEVLPKDRDVAMVFQNYGLLPHMTAYENISFGMKIRKMKKDKIDEKVNWAADILELKDYLHIKPKNLSGGQRQRVAIARAIVREPKLFLMDEPLSNLDAKLRESTCEEIYNLHKRLNATTLYVTHDQTEALTMADRIVVLKEGKIQQIGTPMEIYLKPKNVFVAKFIGKPEINLFNMEINNNKIILNSKIELNISKDFPKIEQHKSYILGIRPENIVLQEDGPIKAIIEKIEYLGGEIVLVLRALGERIFLKTFNLKNFNVGDTINVNFNLDKVNIFNIKTKERIGEINL